MIARLFTLCPIALVLACTDPTDSGQDTAADQARVFVHVIPDCVSSLEQNCEPSLHLCADGTSYAQVTDIINVGSYIETPETITTDFPGADVPASWVFTVSEDSGDMTDDWMGWAWASREEYEFPLCG